MNSYLMQLFKKQNKKRNQFLETYQPSEMNIQRKGLALGLFKNGEEIL